MPMIVTMGPFLWGKTAGHDAEELALLAVLKYSLEPTGSLSAYGLEASPVSFNKYAFTFRYESIT